MEQPENKQKENGTLSPIGEIELEACRLRFEGYTYEKMAEKLLIFYGDRAPAEKTLTKWFYKSGKLYDFYVSYADSEAKARRSEVINIFRAHLSTATRTLVSLLNSKMDMVKLAAAREIINRELGEPLKVVAPPDQKGANLAREILQEAGLLNDDRKQTD